MDCNPLRLKMAAVAANGAAVHAIKIDRSRPAGTCDCCDTAAMPEKALTLPNPARLNSRYASAGLRISRACTSSVGIERLLSATSAPNKAAS